MKLCRNCGAKVVSQKRAICWRCHHKKYSPAKGYHGPHHCNYCGEVGHNILTCKRRKYIDVQTTKGEPMKERRPKGKRWGQLSSPAVVEKTTESCSVWCRGGSTVISALELAKYPDGPEIGLQWHISIAHINGRPSVVSGVLRAFGMERAEEDNHHPGVSRHFWMPVDPAHRVDCECKTDEETIVDSDGYRWTNPKDGECRGCEFSRLTGKPCPIHERLDYAQGSGSI